LENPLGGGTCGPKGGKGNKQNLSGTKKRNWWYFRKRGKKPVELLWEYVISKKGKKKR